MAVVVSRDLTVQVLEDMNAVKLSDRQQALRTAIQRGEPKSLGVSQVMLGLMVISYSIPLHSAAVTEVIYLAVPWWSGLAFIAAGVTAIILDKHSNIKNLRVCLHVSLVSTLLCVAAVVIYSVDMERNPEAPCSANNDGPCNAKYFVTKVSRGLKSSLILFTLVQLVLSALVCVLLFKQRRSYGQYTSLTQAPSTPTSITHPDLE